MSNWRTPRRAALGTMLLALVLAVGLSPSAEAQEGPRLGAYKVVLVQLTSGVSTSQLVLQAGGAYEVYDMPARSLRSRGTYRYDAAARRVIWLSGLNHEMGRGGTFTVEEGGRVHRILMGPKVYAINGD
jgi:hypothetical protein